MKRRLMVAGVAAGALSACVTTGGGPNLSQANLKKAARLNAELGTAYMHRGYNDRAKSKLQLALKENPDLAAAHAGLAMLYSKQGRIERAKSHYARALDLAPDNPSVSNQYGTFLCQRDHYKKAQRYFKRAADNPDYETPEVALTNAGVCERRQHQFNKAAAYFRKALRINPKYPAALEQLADLSYREGHYLQTKALLQRYDSLKKPTADTLLLEVRAFQALGDTQKAAKYAQKLQSRFPASTQIQKLEQRPSYE